MDDLTNGLSVLIVDDTPHNIDILINTLDDTYELQVATSGKDALESVSESIPDLILLDIMMPEMDGFEVCSILKSKSDTKHIPIIFLTALTEIEQKTKGFELGAADFITKPFDIREVKARVKNHLLIKFSQDILKDQNKTLAKLVKKRTSQIENIQDVTIRMAASLAETRDNETGTHILRTQKYVELLATELINDYEIDDELTEDDLPLLIKSAPLHDIGKIGVPDNILLKPGKLTKDEFEIMKKHTIYGKESLLKAEEEIRGESFLKYAKEIAYTHHEKWNGSGYPCGLSGSSIPISGRIMAIADVYDALISKRIYKPPFSHDKAVEIIKNDSGTHFDPDLIECFLDIEESFKDIAFKYAESEEERKAL